MYRWIVRIRKWLRLIYEFFFILLLIDDVFLLSEMKIRIHGTYFYYAISDGVLHVKKDETVLLLNSIERSDEIDVDRANKAKERAEQRLLRKYDDDEVDVIRAESALKRALNRIKVATKL